MVEGESIDKGGSEGEDKNLERKKHLNYFSSKEKAARNQQVSTLLY